MTRLGMDVEAVEDAGRQLRIEAAAITQLLSTIDRAVNALPSIWDGRDGAIFVRQSWPRLRGMLVAARDAVDGLGESALRNATEQRLASGSGVPFVGLLGIPPSGVQTLPVDLLHPSARDAGGHAQGVLAVDAGLSAERQESLVVDRDGAHAHVDAKFAAGASADASVAYTAGLVGAAASASAFAGARGSVGAGVDVGRDGLTAKVGADGFAGVEANAHADVDVAGVKAGVDGSVMAGVGFKADASVSVNMQEFKVDLDFGAAVGIGAEFHPTIEFSPVDMVNKLTSLAGWNPFAS